MAASGKQANFVPFSKDRHVAPNLMRRQLIFDSLSKLNKQKKGGSDRSGARGTLLYTWGAGYHGQLGSSTYRKKCQRLPSLLDFEEAAVQVACGGFHNALLTDNGKVYTWGDGRLGQLGNLARKHNMLSTPHLVEDLVHSKITISQVACGQYHTAAVSSVGKLYSWGSGKHGQLGHGTRLDKRYPEEVTHCTNNKPVCRFTTVTCGDRHTCALSVKKELMSFGSGQHGQLGHGDGQDHLRPHKVLHLLEGKAVIQADAGATHTACITDDGSLFVWGFGESLHPKEFSNIVDKPRQVKLMQPARQVACGQSHVIVLTIDGDVWTFGNSGMGQLGHGAFTNVRSPRLVLAGKKIFQVAAGRYHSMAVSSFGVLFSWGCGESGQLAHDTLDNEAFPRPVESILGNVVGSISCGEHHSFCLSSIEHTSVAKDVEQWLAVEEEELKRKKSLSKERPNGLKSKDVLMMMTERKEIMTKFQRDKTKEQEQEDRHLNEQINSIRSWEQLHQEVMDAYEFNQAAERKGVRSDPLTVGADGMVNVKPPTTIAKAEKVDRDDNMGPQWTKLSRKPRASNRTKLAALEGVEAKPLLNQLEAAEPLFKKRAGPAAVVSNKKGAGAARQPGRRARPGTAGLVHSASAPALEPALRPGSAGRKVPITFQPLAPRMMFMERTTHTLGKLKRYLSSSELGTVGQPRSSAGGSSWSESDLFKLKKEFNALQAIKKRKGEALSELRNSLHYLQPSEEDKRGQKQAGKRMTDLNMKLVTLNTRLMEAEENKKNYELYIIRMKEEDVQLSKQIDHLRQLVTEYDRLLTKMSRMNKKVTSQKSDLDEEIVQFHDDIEGFADFADMQLNRYKSIVEHSLHSKVEKDKTEEQKREIRKKKERDAKERIEDENKREEASEVKEELDGWMGKVEYYEKRFHKITAATGLTRPDDIVNKFFFNDEITEDLQREINKRKARLAELTEKQTTVNSSLTSAQNSFNVSKWSDVGNLKTQYEGSSAKINKDKIDAHRLLRQISFVQEGTEQITRTLEETLGALPADLQQTAVQPPEDPSDTFQSSVWWAATLAKRIDHLLQLVDPTAEDEEESAREPSTKAELSNFAAQGFLRAAQGRKWGDDEESEF